MCRKYNHSMASSQSQMQEAQQAGMPDSQGLQGQTSMMHHAPTASVGGPSKQIPQAINMSASGPENNRQFNTKMVAAVDLPMKKGVSVSPRAPLSPRLPNGQALLDSMTSTAPSISENKSATKSAVSPAKGQTVNNNMESNSKTSSGKVKRTNSPRGEDNVLPLVNKVAGNGGSSPTSSINTRVSEDRKTKIDPRK
mmetsp:Transcript_6334/g.23418  ORF Transcript_6334/g.23418 Transcript_6334/m.23418 type:complete len:196 (-) Transcript_6334:504-1091(-)